MTCNDILTFGKDVKMTSVDKGKKPWKNNQMQNVDIYVISYFFLRLFLVASTKNLWNNLLPLYHHFSIRHGFYFIFFFTINSWFLGFFLWYVLNEPRILFRYFLSRKLKENKKEREVIIHMRCIISKSHENIITQPLQVKRYTLYIYCKGYSMNKITQRTPLVTNYLLSLYKVTNTQF